MERVTPWFTLVCATLLTALALWSMRTILGPILATGAVFALLWPSRSHPGVRRVLVVLALLVVVWILAQARSVVYPALAGLALAFLLDPVVERLGKLGIGRRVAALIVIIPVLALIVLFVLFVIPALIEQARSLIEQIPRAYEVAAAWLLPKLNRLLAGQVPNMPSDLSSLLPSPEQILHAITQGFVHVGRGIAAVVRVAAFLLLTPILAYYMIVDFDRLEDTLRGYLSPAWGARLAILGRSFQDSVGGWLKGQLIVAVVISSLSIAGFLLIGLPYALLLGVVAGVLNLVPVLGFWVTALLALIITLFTPHPLTMIWRTALVIVVIQGLEQNVLSPLFVGRRLRVKPVVLLIVMLGMGALLGVVGVLLAAPAIGLVNGIWALLDFRPPYAPKPEGTPPLPQQPA
ncbi:MAG: AI-2E family transporter [Candidatus Eisenbacteria bacterium]|nr:AI-2E family transporter [Candidatus Eisenbacteria bacterium]